MFRSVLVVSDNETISKGLVSILEAQPELTAGRKFAFACSPQNETLKSKKLGNYAFMPMDIKSEQAKIRENFDLIISAHCKQLFPEGLVEAVTCINLHPGYNPYNRGWYPQVFSILNGQPLGATIHIIDRQLDHGPIIDREQVELRASDTSLSAYEKVQKKEIVLLRRNLADILEGSYKTYAPETEGSVNLKADFNKLREIDLGETVTYRQAIDRLRALTHPPFKNGYFLDPETQRKIWVRIELEEDEPTEKDG